MNRSAVLSLAVAQAVIAINWFAIASVYYQIAIEFRQDVSGLGLITSAFIVSVGLFQVPGGILAAKVGPRRLVISGMVVASVASALAGFVQEFYLLVAIRFIAGIGMAVVPSSIMMLISRYLGRGSAGLGIGIAEGVYSLGGIIGVSCWAVLPELIGWRTSLVLGGSLGIIAVPLLVWALPTERTSVEFNVRMADIKRIMTGRTFLIVGMVLLALDIGWSVNGYFMVFYLENHLGVTPSIAGLIGSMTLFMGIVVSPIMGRLNDRIESPKMLLMATGIVSALGLVVASSGSVDGAIVSTVLVGSSNAMGFTVGYIAAREATGHNQEYEALAMAWVGTIALIGTFWVPGLFSSLAIMSGYPLAWVAAALSTVVLTLPIVLMRRGPER